MVRAITSVYQVLCCYQVFEPQTLVSELPVRNSLCFFFYLQWLSLQLYYLWRFLSHTEFLTNYFFSQIISHFFWNPVTHVRLSILPHNSLKAGLFSSSLSFFSSYLLIRFFFC